MKNMYIGLVVAIYMTLPLAVTGWECIHDGDPCHHLYQIMQDDYNADKEKGRDPTQSSKSGQPNCVRLLKCMRDQCELTFKYSLDRDEQNTFYDTLEKRYKCSGVASPQPHGLVVVLIMAGLAVAASAWTVYWAAWTEL